MRQDLRIPLSKKKYKSPKKERKFNCKRDAIVYTGGAGCGVFRVCVLVCGKRFEATEPLIFNAAKSGWWGSTKVVALICNPAEWCLFVFGRMVSSEKARSGQLRMDRSKKSWRRYQVQVPKFGVVLSWLLFTLHRYLRLLEGSSAQIFRSFTQKQKSSADTHFWCVAKLTLFHPAPSTRLFSAYAQLLYRET